MVTKTSSQDALSRARELALAGLMGALGLLLPIGFHALGWGGSVFLPMHLPVVVAGFLVGPAAAATLDKALDVAKKLFELKKVAKDDEMLSDVPWSTLRERSRLVGEMRRRCEQETGEKKMYLANITDEVHRMIELCDIAVAGGANSVMINTMATGISAARMVRRHAEVPLVSHFDFLAPFTSVPTFGVHSKVITKLQRMVGFDVIIMPGFGERMKVPEAEVLECVQECFKPLGSMKKSLPVPAGSQWAGTTGFLYEKLGTADFGIVPGRAVFEHPMGAEAGARSLRLGWEAVTQGRTLEEHARYHDELREALRMHSG